MQLSILFALLPILAHAAPVSIGGLPNLSTGWTHGVIGPVGTVPDGEVPDAVAAAAAKAGAGLGLKVHVSPRQLLPVPIAPCTGGRCLSGLSAAISNIPAAPALALPSPAVPSDATLPIALPSITPPNVVLGSVKLPHVATPSIRLPSVILPSVGLPTVAPPSIPSITPPNIKLPDVILPDVKVPDVYIPDIVLPNVIVPQEIVPSIIVPDVVIPDVTISDIIVPSMTASDVVVSSVTFADIVVPTLSIPDIAVPSITPPGGSLPSVNLPAVAVPSVGGTDLTGIVGAAVQPIITGAAAKVLSDLGKYITGLNPTNMLDAVAQLAKIDSGLDQVLQNQLKTLDDRATLLDTLQNFADMSSALSGYLNGLPKAIASAATVTPLISLSDGKMASYLQGLLNLGMSPETLRTVLANAGWSFGGLSIWMPMTSNTMGFGASASM